MLKPEKIQELEQISLSYRKRILTLSRNHSFGLHIGGSLSLTDIFTALYFHAARIDPLKPDWTDRDRIILSKGHANIGLMTILAMRGFFPISELETFNRYGSIYSMHADARVPGVEHSAGSLGHGVSVAVGIALIGKMEKTAWKVYCILGDGESMEGSVWESFMSAAHFGLDNLIYILDRNGLSQESLTEEVMSLEPLARKCTAFGLSVDEIDGHDLQAIVAALEKRKGPGPRIIIAHTRKGLGVANYESQIRSHFAHLDEETCKESMNLINKTGSLRN